MDSQILRHIELLHLTDKHFSLVGNTLRFDSPVALLAHQSTFVVLNSKWRLRHHHFAAVTVMITFYVEMWRYSSIPFRR